MATGTNGIATSSDILSEFGVGSAGNQCPTLFTIKSLGLTVNPGDRTYVDSQCVVFSDIASSKATFFIRNSAGVSDSSVSFPLKLNIKNSSSLGATTISTYSFTSWTSSFQIDVKNNADYYLTTSIWIGSVGTEWQITTEQGDQSGPFTLLIKDHFYGGKNYSFKLVKTT